MSEPQPASSERTHHSNGGKAPAVVPVPGEPILSDGAPLADDQPTIISKHAPANAESLNGALRGRNLAHFELIEPIGVGGMAAVIRARDTQLDRMVALKILPPEMAADPENVRRFHQEARAAARLDHENIARVYFCGEDQRLHFIAFEFVEGVNLRTLLERRGRLPVAEAVHYLLQIATGLAHAASRGVVHRDIKPSNIIISPNGRAKLVDMGLARSSLPHEDKALTQSGVTLGTFDYISPEQALEPRQADVRSDIYSLGCTFYHMLTGQAPVPEGTAAKKLHYHQHVAPVDPRQLNGGVPDEVAAILQRMMAKDPKDRYQRAEHLVQHLIQVAQKLGAPADVPDGVLFVDAPLPSPPRKRPLALAAAGAVVLMLFLVALSVAPPRTGSAFTPFKATQLAEVKPQPKDNGDGGAKKSDKGTPHEAQTVKNEAELRKILTAKDPPAAATVVDHLSLTESVVFRGRPDRELAVSAAEPYKPVKLTIASPESRRAGPDDRGWGGIVVEGGKVTFRDLVFELTADATPEALIAAVLVREGGSVEFMRCAFVQPAVPMGTLLGQRHLVPVASVATWNAGSPASRPRVAFRECWFQRGQAALSLHGSADVEQTSCAYSPHATLFHLRGGDGKFATRIDLHNVSAHLGHGPAFRLDNFATCKLDVTHSIFSGPERNGAEEPRDPADFIRQTDTAKQRSVVYTGRRNCYHQMHSMYARAVKETAPTLETWDAFRSAIAEKEGSDEGSSYLTAGSPWKTPGAAAEKDPLRAFSINRTLAELRLPDLRTPIGVGECFWGSTNKGIEKLDAKRPPPEAVAKLKPNEKVVDPKVQPGAGYFQTVAGALAEARNGDVILIKHNGPVPVHPVEIKADLQVTLKPYPDHRPVLTLADRTTAPEAALFTLFSGEIVFEGLEFHLRPDREDFRSQTVLKMTGGGKASFKQCAVTLEGVDGLHVPLSVATVCEPRDAMKGMAPDPGTPPAVTFQQCLVRGEGELAAVRGGRAFELKVSGSLVALSGSLVYVEGSATEMMPAGVSKLTLSRTTAYVSDHLAYLRAGKSGKGLAFLQATANNCLFAAAGGKSLVYLDGPDGEEQMKKLFGWIGRGNIYSGYEKMLEQQSSGEAVPTVRYGPENWQRVWNEGPPEPRFARVKFDAAPAAERPLSQIVPEDFRGKADPETDLTGCGASVEQLPRPAGDRVRPAADGPQPPRGTEGELWHDEGVFPQGFPFLRPTDRE